MRRPHSKSRGTAALLLLVVASALMTGCHWRVNPVDPGSSTYTGDPIYRDPEDAPPVLPSIVRWQSVAEHADGSFLALEIPAAEYGEPGYFVEPRRPVPGRQLYLVVVFEEAVYQETLNDALIVVSRRTAALPPNDLVTEIQHDVQAQPEQRRIVIGYEAPDVPANNDYFTLRIRIVDPNGSIAGERAFGVLPGDVNGDGVVTSADNAEGPALFDGFFVSADENLIRSDTDADGSISAAADNTAISDFSGVGLPGSPDEFDGSNPNTRFQVTFYGNGNDTGSPPVDAAKYDPGDNAAALPDGALLMTRSGYSFDGWNTKPNGSGTSYAPGATPVMAAANLSLYAQWTISAAQYTVTYDPNGGTGSIVDPASPYITGSLVTVLGSGGFTLAGYRFVEWNVAADGSGISYNDSGAETFTITSDTTLYAQWEPDFAGGDGTGPTPFQISTPQHLDNVRYFLNSFFELVSDIDLGVPPYDTAPGWQPIGTSGTPFEGVLTGNGYEIRNLLIDRGQLGVGLFGYLANADITDLIFRAPTIVNAGQNTGTLAGAAQGGPVSIARVGVVGPGSVQSGSANYNVGGLIGYGQLVTITESFSQIVVDGGDNVGGLVGFLTSGTVADSYATGTVTGTDLTLATTGGLIGDSGGNVFRSYAGAVVSSATLDSGGLIGNSSGSVTDSYYDQDVSGQSDTGKGEPRLTVVMVLQVTYSPWDFVTVWEIQDGISYPYLQWQLGADIPFP